jgi:hypothetical protein
MFPEAHPPLEVLDHEIRVGSNTLASEVVQEDEEEERPEPTTEPFTADVVAKLEPEPCPDGKNVLEPPSQPKRAYRSRMVNFKVVDELNQRLGKRGEQLVVEYERRRLIAAFRPDLAERVQHVSQSEGDGAGYDVLSFTANGDEMYIEVKTTNLGKNSPFFISLNELEFSSEHSDQFYLYRIFNLAQTPRLFILKGSLRECRLEPTQFRVTSS